VPLLLLVLPNVLVLPNADDDAAAADDGEPNALVAAAPKPPNAEPEPKPEPKLDPNALEEDDAAELGLPNELENADPVAALPPNVEPNELDPNADTVEPNALASNEGAGVVVLLDDEEEAGAAVLAAAAAGCADTTGAAPKALVTGWSSSCAPNDLNTLFDADADAEEEVDGSSPNTGTLTPSTAAPKAEEAAAANAPFFPEPQLCSSSAEVLNAATSAGVGTGTEDLAGVVNAEEGSALASSSPAASSASSPASSPSSCCLSSSPFSPSS